MNLDSPSRWGELQATIAAKAGLRRFYERVYSIYAHQIASLPGSLRGDDAVLVELGSGAGFAKEKIPALRTTDVIAYPNIDQVVDACAMPFDDESVSCFFLLNTFHHISDAERFLREADRCLKARGRIVIIDQHFGWISRFILRFLHHEPYQPMASSWSFPTSGPLSGANGALAWIVFERDRRQFEVLFPGLQIVRYRPFAPLFYWLTGGLKSWQITQTWNLRWFEVLDELLLRLHSRLGSFVEIVLEKRGVEK